MPIDAAASSGDSGAGRSDGGYHQCSVTAPVSPSATLADWRRKARERDMAVNFAVREENLWAVARYMPGKPVSWIPGLSGSEIRFHGKTPISLVAKARRHTGRGIAGTPCCLDGHAGLSQSVYAIKALVAEVSASVTSAQSYWHASAD